MAVFRATLRPIVAAVALFTLLLGAASARAADRTFASESLIVPMDLPYQDNGMFQAFGLVFELLRQGVTVYWAIDPAKTWHAAPCNTPSDLCSWDCGVQGSGVKCAYPTASPDFFAASQVLWDDKGGAPGQVIASHGYRGGPFIIDAADSAAARPIIDAWNDPTLWPSAPWAERAVIKVVSVHQATAGFVAPVRRKLIAPPRLAILADGNETIATAYLRAAGIPQSNGAEFPATVCGAGACGPGTSNPSILTLPSVMGDLGTCDAPNQNHRNGALFTPAGEPAFCQVVSAHWQVADREKVLCNGGACPPTPADCAGQPITFHGHELVAEVRAFLQHPVNFIAECQAVVAFENTTPNPAWPYLDDAARDGHFLTIPGTPPACPCTEPGFQCVNGGCVPIVATELGAGFLVGPPPDSATLQVRQPAATPNQFDGAFATVGGSEPSFDLSAYFGTAYRNNRDVTLLTGAPGPGEEDVWISGALDGGGGGMVNYLGGHQYGTSVPVTGTSQGTRLFLNALFDASCMSDEPEKGRLFTTPPCRLYDSRDDPSGPIPGGQTREILARGFVGSCPLLTSAVRNLAINVTAVSATAAGYLQLYPANIPTPDATVISFGAGQTRANNAVLNLATDGTGTFAIRSGQQPGQAVHVIVDVTGYFD